jgi:hypothetical protein
MENQATSKAIAAMEGRHKTMIGAGIVFSEAFD